MVKKKKIKKGAAKKTSKKAVKHVIFNDPMLASTNKKILDFLALEKGKRIAIISDNDADGVTSAAQMKIFLDSKRVESMVFFYDHFSKTFSYPLQSFNQFSPEKTIFLDLSDGFVSDVVEQLGNATGPFLVIDHHQREVIRGNAYKNLVIKPSSFSAVEPSKYPVSKMVFDLLGGRDWVCSIGVIGDFAFEQWADFLTKTQKRYRLTPKKLFALAEIVECITSQYSEKINSLCEFLVAQASPSKLASSDYVALKKLFDARLKLLENVFEKEAEKFEDVGVYFFKCDNRFSAKLSTVVSQKHKNKVIIIYEQPGDFVKCSIRRQDFLVNCGFLAKAGVNGIAEGKGGGHIPAAGASFPKANLDQFKKQIRIYLLQNPPKESLVKKQN